MTIRPTFFLRFCTLLLLAGASANSLAAENGVTAEEILVGQSSPLSGPMSNGQGKAARIGAEIYIKKINAAGGVHGRKIKVITYDDSYQPTEAGKNLDRLVNQDKVFCVFNFYGSSVAKFVLPKIDALDVPLIGMITSDETFRSTPHKNVFLVRPSSTIEYGELIKFAFEKEQQKKFGIFMQNDDLGFSSRQAVLSALHKYDAKIMAEGSYERKTVDVAPAVKALAASKPDVLILAGQTEAAAAFVNAAIEADYRPMYLTNVNNASADFITNLKNPKDVKLYITLMTPPTDETPAIPLMVQYLKDAKIAGIAPDPGHLEGYLNALVLTEGLKRAGETPTRASLISGLESMDEFDAGGIKFSYGPNNRRGSSTVFIRTLKNGKFSAL